MWQGTAKTCYWVTAMMVLMGGLTYSVYSLTSLYISYPTSVTVSIQQGQQLVFPAVTICNMSPVKKSALESIDIKKRKRRKKRSTCQIYVILDLTMLSFFPEKIIIFFLNLTWYIIMGGLASPNLHTFYGLLPSSPFSLYFFPSLSLSFLSLPFPFPPFP